MEAEKYFYLKSVAIVPAEGDFYGDRRSDSQNQGKLPIIRRALGWVLRKLLDDYTEYLDIALKVDNPGMGC
jgi:hypothetical protein